MNALPMGTLQHCRVPQRLQASLRHRHPFTTMVEGGRGVHREVACGTTTVSSTSMGTTMLLFQNTAVGIRDALTDTYDIGSLAGPGRATAML